MMAGDHGGDIVWPGQTEGLRSGLGVTPAPPLPGSGGWDPLSVAGAPTPG